MKNKFTSALLFAGIFCLSSVELFAGGPPPPPNALPVDGGLTLVLAVCAGYGVKKINDSRKK